MSHVMAVFDRLQYRFSLPGEAWDVMWSHSYPYNTFKEDLKNLLPHQKINHFPGTSCIVSKPKLSTQGFSFTPRTFRLPYDAEHLLAVVSYQREEWTNVIRKIMCSMMVLGQRKSREIVGTKEQ